MPDSMQREEHPAIKFLRELHLQPPSTEFQKCISNFQAPHGLDNEQFIQGIKLFISMANMKAAERKIFYGSEYLGVHYPTDLADIYNSDSSNSKAPVSYCDLMRIRPPKWLRTVQDNSDISLSYLGDEPSQALDSLIKGPSVIDCGMFCQLSIWFGIKYMLGEAQFNQLFGRAPFHLTQLLFSPTEPDKPYLGNPLFPFFQKQLPAADDLRNVSVGYLYNDLSYELKHPGGPSKGLNYLDIEGGLTSFLPKKVRSSGLSKEEVTAYLLNQYNAPQDKHDKHALKTFLELIKTNPEAISNICNCWEMPYSQRITEAEDFADFQIESIKTPADASQTKITFNLLKLKLWVDTVLNPSIAVGEDYKPTSHGDLNLPDELLEQIPFENRESMSFDRFTTENPFHKQLLLLLKNFCHHVMHGESVRLDLSGEAGIGKTAAATCCAKELVHRSKNVLWFSEVTIQTLFASAKSFEEYNLVLQKIQAMLNSSVDVVILDDDNLTTDAGILILQEIYRWYATNPGKGLLITANCTITFEDCFSPGSDKKSLCAPHPSYDSPQFMNTRILKDLVSFSMRPSINEKFMDQPATERISALLNCRADTSAGIIIRPTDYDTLLPKLSNQSMTFVPSILAKEINTITMSLVQNKGRGDVPGPVYDQWSRLKKIWTERFEVRESRTDRRDYLGIRQRSFQSTSDRYIVVEVEDAIDWQGKVCIDPNSYCQLLRIIHFVFDRGNGRLVVINKTRLTDKDLLTLFIQQSSENEKARITARIEQIFKNPALETKTEPFAHSIRLHSQHESRGGGAKREEHEGGAKPEESKSSQGAAPPAKP
jgi:hypothetical protein